MKISLNLNLNLTLNLSLCRWRPPLNQGDVGKTKWNHSLITLRLKTALVSNNNIFL